MRELITEKDHATYAEHCTLFGYLGSSWSHFVVPSEEPPLLAYLELLPPRRGRELSPRQSEVFLKEKKVGVKWWADLKLSGDL